MTNRFLISVATAALIAGTGFANAQGTAPGRDAGSAGSTAQQSAPPSGGASSGGAMQRDSGPSGMKGAETGTTKEPSTKASESTDKMAPSKSAQDSNRMQGEKSKSMHSETDSAKGGKDMKAEGRDSKSGDMNNAQTKGATDTKSGTAASETKSPTTTGNAATSATAAPPAEKRAQINTAFRSEKIQETTNVNFNISVGAAIPASVHFHPIPARIVEIYPEWRGYDVILVGGRYVIVRPQTREIVYIIEG
ncbi:DUF1236 domain-containing protein [Bradyrhizobium sp. McL0615]|uniref:DUF1236 domain-containing protein n=1 Tax=Bradyrhizobium sp. McL0615 TaxID=3415673 RepID=UPI003CF8A7D4